jgi:hypothetical protein
MINFDHFAYNKTILPEEANIKTKFFEELEQIFYKELIHSEKAIEYFKNYSSFSIEGFMKSYASKKAHLVQCYEFYQQTYLEKETTDLGYQKKAEDLLMSILQKKLFNMQLLWRAGKLDIDGIQLCYDFQFWEKYIASCPFIDPITDSEVEMIKDFLMLSSEEDQFEHYNGVSWQDYDGNMIRDEHGVLQDMPEWYDFYDMRMGTDTLLLLPNHKGAREEFYMGLTREENRKNNPPKNEFKVDPKPIIIGYGRDITDFAQYFESDKYFIELFKYYSFYQEMENRNPNGEDIREALDILFNADRPIHFLPHLNWDQAIMEASRRYSNTRTIETIDFVFEQYNLMKDLGISHYENTEKIKEEYEKDMIIGIYRDSILKGRVINGEPPDFNY